jgi:hypothetical protein
VNEETYNFPGGKVGIVDKGKFITSRKQEDGNEKSTGIFAILISL